MQPYEVGGWIKCTKDATSTCKVGNYYEIVEVCRDRTLVTVKVGKETRRLWTTLKAHEGYERYVECEWAGETNPNPEANSDYPIF